MLFGCYANDQQADHIRQIPVFPRLLIPYYTNTYIIHKNKERRKAEGI